MHVAAKRRTLTSAWIETVKGHNIYNCMKVALSRVRGLKHHAGEEETFRQLSHSHECVD